MSANVETEAMWIVAISAIGALIRPQGCGPITQAWAHYYPYAGHNINVRCNESAAIEFPEQITRGNTVSLRCRTDAECAVMLEAVIFGRTTNTFDVVNEVATELNTVSAACVNASDCVVPYKFNCVSVTNGSGYCAPKFNQSYRTWETACFSGAHATCTELIIGAIGIGAGTLLSLGELLLYK